MKNYTVVFNYSGDLNFSKSRSEVVKAVSAEEAKKLIEKSWDQVEVVSIFEGEHKDALR